MSTAELCALTEDGDLRDELLVQVAKAVVGSHHPGLLHRPAVRGVRMAAGFIQLPRVATWAPPSNVRRRGVDGRLHVLGVEVVGGHGLEDAHEAKVLQVGADGGEQEGTHGRGLRVGEAAEGHGLEVVGAGVVHLRITQHSSG